MLRAITMIGFIAGAVLLTQLIPHGLQQATHQAPAERSLSPGDNTLASWASRPDTPPDISLDDDGDDDGGDEEVVRDMRGARVTTHGLVGRYFAIEPSARSGYRTASADSQCPAAACDFRRMDAPHAPPWRPPIYVPATLAA